MPRKLVDRDARRFIEADAAQPAALNRAERLGD
jgi:hypothetical protein